MDEIDGMNNGDKGGINALIKLVRPKKTKKQKNEEFSMNPIICIGNCYVDKKIKELMKVCNTFELKNPSNSEILQIIKLLFPSISETFTNDISNYVDGDLTKLNNIYKIYKNGDMNTNIFEKKKYNYDTKKITRNLINNKVHFHDHIHTINETDRTIVGLLWHENIIDHFENLNKEKSIDLYLKQLDNICFADYIDRITFQKQIWQFNEMSSLIKTFKNNHIYHAFNTTKIKNNDIRFTKVLTKYSTEYNNSIFIQNLCQQLGMDKKDLFVFFMDLKEKCFENKMEEIFENYEIKKLDINRIFRYLDKYTKDVNVLDNDIEYDEYILQNPVPIEDI